METKKEKKEDNNKESQQSVAAPPSILERLVAAIDKKRSLWLTAVGVVVVGLLAFGIVNYRRQKRETEAKKLLAPIEIALRAGEYEVALEGGGGEIGVLKFIEEYKGTSIVNIAHVYAAIAFYERKKGGNAEKQQQDEKKAIAHLHSFRLKGSYLQPLIWSKIASIYNDAKMYDKALVCYEKAVNYKSNKWLVPLYLDKMATIYETQGKYQKAIDCYKRIYTEYPDSTEAEEAKKHKGRLQAILRHKAK
ncbi:MAG: tetratricopeptide repeat protein [Bacteroidota bacterium]